MLIAAVGVCVLIAALVAFYLSKKSKANDVDQITMDDFIPKDGKGNVDSAYIDPLDTLLQSIDSNLAKFEVNSGVLTTEGMFHMRNHINEHCIKEFQTRKEELF
jgi:hypothetical protein